MDEPLLDLLNKVTLLDFVWTFALILVTIGILLSQKKKLYKYFDQWRRNKNEEENFNTLVHHLKISVEEIRKNIEQDRAAMDKQSKSIENLTKIVVEMQEKNSKTKRAEIKEKIERIYSECHCAMTCTDMQFETLKELIEEYEEHGGMNSFVHSTVEPEMHTWKKINRIRKDG